MPGGDTIHVETEVVEKQVRDESSGVVSLRQTIKNQRGEDVVIGTMRLLVARAN